MSSQWFASWKSFIFCVQKKAFMFCIEQTRIKFVYFDVVNNFNHVLQNIVKLRW